MNVLDMNSATCILAQFHHWALKVENRGEKRGHSCTILHDGKRITKYGELPIDAVRKAISAALLPARSGSKTDLRLAT